MRHLGFVQAEGGPLVLLDTALARSWAGIAGSDYNRACDFFDSHPDAEGGIITVGPGWALVWEMGGAGTADISESQDRSVVVVRAWPSSAADKSVVKTLAA